MVLETSVYHARFKPFVVLFLKGAYFYNVHKMILECDQTAFSAAILTVCFLVPEFEV